jgi:hypothetical protein
MGQYDPEVHYVTCTCYSVNHTIEFVANDDPEDEDLMYVAVQLHRYEWWRRLWIGIRYILGYRSVYGHWDCTSLGELEVAKLRAFLDVAATRRG